MSARLTLSRPTTTSTLVAQPARLTRRQRREERELLAQLATRPDNVRDELLEMIYRPN
ncbi:hypothetical protein MWU75_15765 [Ornithinimicrobium sp. F0845]|uniref:hypothetical protein n=1 Tax=Ornithinimicrobium sp. F0845 TaxID=2926412 RepID=UPI001FF55377|nr:hypothetical protein [Ornithinimicrobium sp. F0845]MCK0113603.1 hypothetical protein [Ornithinimicrobium sp. F0845]